MRGGVFLQILVCLLGILSLCSCRKDETSEKILPSCLIKEFSIKDIGNSLHSLNIDVDKKEIKFESDLPLSVDLSKLIIFFKTEPGVELRTIDGTLLHSGESILNLITPVTIELFFNGDKVSEYVINVRKKVSDDFALLNIKGVFSGLEEIPLIIKNDLIFNRIILNDNLELSKVVFDYEASYSGILYLNGEEIESGVTLLDCTEENKFRLISPDGQIRDYSLTLYKSNNSLNEVRYNWGNVKHEYIGGGFTFNLYHGHIFSMSEINQAVFYELMFDKFDIDYILYNYKLRPQDLTKNLEMFDKFLDKAKEYKPDLKVVALIADFPDDMKTTKVLDGEKLSILDVAREGIYDEVVEYIYQIITDILERGHRVDIISMCNEPDWEKKWLWGYADSKEGIRQLIKKTVPKLLEKLSENNMDKPLIMVPATISPKSCFNYVNYLKNDDEVWSLIDIINTHQYVDGCNQIAFQDIKGAIVGKQFIQSEQHVNKGDDLELFDIDRGQRGIASLMSMYEVAVNNGVSSWCYFVANMPGVDSNVGLMQVAWGGSPIPYKQYYAYKQLHSYYDNNASVIESHSTNKDLKVVALKSEGENKCIVHIGNISESNILITLDLGRDVKGIEIWETNKEKNMECIEVIQEEMLGKDLDLVISVDELSLYTVVINY